MPISSSNVRLTNMTDFEIRAKNVTAKWSQINQELQNRRESVVEKVLDNVKTSVKSGIFCHIAIDKLEDRLMSKFYFC